FEAQLLEAVRERAPGESVLHAFSRFVLEPRGFLAQGDAESLTKISRIIMGSPDLLAREEQVLSTYTASLAALIAEETGAGADEIEPWVAANALLGVHRALIGYVRRRVLAGATGPRLARAVHGRGEHALALLERGLGSYAVRPPETAS